MVLYFSIQSTARPPEDCLTIHQTLIDPGGLNEWSLYLTLDLEKSNEARTPVLHLESIAPI